VARNLPAKSARAPSTYGCSTRGFQHRPFALQFRRRGKAVVPKHQPSSTSACPILARTLRKFFCRDAGRGSRREKNCSPVKFLKQMNPQKPSTCFMSPLSAARRARSTRLEGIALANRKLAAEKSPAAFPAHACRRIRLQGRGSGICMSLSAGLGFRIRFENSRALFPLCGRCGPLPRPTCFVFRPIILPKTKPGNLIEALAFGLPIVTTRWRSIPEMLPPNYPGLVDPKSPGQIAEALQRLVGKRFF